MGRKAATSSSSCLSFSSSDESGTGTALKYTTLDGTAASTWEAFVPVDASFFNSFFAALSFPFPLALDWVSLNKSVVNCDYALKETITYLRGLSCKTAVYLLLGLETLSLRGEEAGVGCVFSTTGESKGSSTPAAAAKAFLVSLD